MNHAGPNVLEVKNAPEIKLALEINVVILALVSADKMLNAML